MHYHDSEDLKQLGEFKRFAPTEFLRLCRVRQDRWAGRRCYSQKVPRIDRDCAGMHNSVPLLP